MKMLFMIGIIVVGIRCTTTAQTNIIWTNNFGGSSWDEAKKVLATADSGLIIFGFTESNNINVTGNHGLGDVWVIKISKNGYIDWQKTYGGTDYDYCYDALETGDGGYLFVGHSFSSDGDLSLNLGNADLWLVKISNTGVIQWQKSYGGSEFDGAECAIQTNDGGYLLGGSTSSNDGDIVGGTHAASEDIWILKLNSLGEIDWQKCYGSNLDDHGVYDLVELVDNSFIIASRCRGGGDVIGNHGWEDYWVVKLSITGEIIWQKSFGGSGSDLVSSVTLNSTSNAVYCAGTTYSTNGDVDGNHGEADGWVIKIDTTGNLIWQKCFGGTATDLAYDIIFSADTNFIFCGASLSSDFDLVENKGFTDFWINSIDTTSEIFWQLSLGGSDYDNAFSMTKSADGSDYIVGYSRSNDFDVDSNYGDYDYWVVKIGNCSDYYFADSDGDGFGDLLTDSLACSLPEGFVADSTDCNDADNSIFPFAVDICNTIDDNCNGAIDEDAEFLTWYIDLDEDGYGDIEYDSIACFVLTGYVTDSTDCNDLDNTIFPLAIEICNAIDDNCNDEIDEGLTVNTFYADMDADHFGDVSVFVLSCFDSIPGYVSDSTDCDDTNPLIYPSAIEICNYLDDDCNDIIDDNLTYIHSYQDADSDNFGNIEVDSLACDIPFGYVLDDADCDDTNPDIYPGAPEILNGLDDDCDALIDEDTGLDNLSGNSIHVYPNPTDGLIVIQYESQFPTDFTIHLYNSTGNLILENNFNAICNSGEQILDLNYFAPGIYLINIFSSSQSLVQKIVVQ